ncbi:MAG: hypothetical protein LBR25_03390 [Erysipelotrichaceae bacterium]|jgi:hypothetical protein|nr:hypothetical protein [Erysipelotrichaceae bacterium]
MERSHRECEQLIQFLLKKADPTLLIVTEMDPVHPRPDFSDLRWFVRAAANSLEVSEKLVFEQEFMHRSLNRDNYHLSYSRSTYYRLKDKAMRHFLKFLHEYHVI